MISLFDRELMRMEQEVRDLKTIHQRGLGTVKFFEAEVSASISSYTQFTANLEAGEPANPLAISLINAPEPIDDLRIGLDTVGLIRWAGTNNPPTNVKVKFISSSQISGITQS